jgi:hypothetical protein
MEVFNTTELEETIKKMEAQGYVLKDDEGLTWEKDGELYEYKNKAVVKLTDGEMRTTGNAGSAEAPKNGSTPRQDPYTAMDKLDEEQIEMELSGQFLEQLVYTVGKGPNKVTSLSWAGVKHVAYTMAQKQQPISIEEAHITKDNEKYTVVAWAKNLKTEEKRPGIAEQPFDKEVKIRGAGGVPTGEVKYEKDSFAAQKALSKAQRNAMRALLPEVEVAALIQQTIDEGKKPRGD